MRHFPLITAAWTALLVAGFAVVFLLGAPVPTAAEELEAALRPAPPVSQAAAEATAATIVRLQNPSFEGTERRVTLATDFGVDHWVVEYTDLSGAAPRGLRISVVVDSGRVEVNSFP
ncbi:MAG TPA: hypothetical protein VER83_09255 [Candidatus Nanopelagicales bacterium]|nr:hypothetical protein [Candidatus Nanopelagicales bacterium]